MSETDGPIRIGFSDVDANAQRDRMFTAMDVTGEWPAVQHLRGWELEQLGLAPGMSVLDVGCGPGSVVESLATHVAPGGRVVGVDASEAMVDEARRRAALADTGDVEVAFAVGDATALEVDDASFDAVRSERTLQWVSDPPAALAELVRAVRPGGAVVVLDTDWRTFAMDLPDLTMADRLTAALLSVRGEPAAIGGRLVRLFHEAGLADVRPEVAVHAWTEWDPDSTPAPPGFLPLRDAVPQLASTGVLTTEEADAIVDATEAVARAGHLFMTVTMMGVAGRRPE